ncbi:MAG: tRNA (adenosine(37)-N6)-dimethylallyltransferase MiaA [Bacteroidales bacterium]|nr:tRNA (adenosine(37)-N6)-dimethylallyltransferase MiaA [Bacteroidales bacterium]
MSEVLKGYDDICRLVRSKRDEEIITVLGPTATGKTRLAVRIARDFGGEIISADSRQVYRGMDIGTGKDLEDYVIDGQEIPYHLIDIAEPGMEYNVAQYQQAAYVAMDEIRARGREIVLCGGSGMYIEALLGGYRLAPVTRDPQLYAELSAKTDEELTEILKSFRALHNHTDTCERPRLIKAVEIEYYYQQHPEWKDVTREIPSVIIGLCGDRDLIRSRITRRLKERLDNGMIEEVESLINQGANVNQLLRYGLEYKFVTMFILGQISKEEMFVKLNTAIHQFSKRQMTWFRKMERSGFVIHWVDIAHL